MRSDPIMPLLGLEEGTLRLGTTLPTTEATHPIEFSTLVIDFKACFQGSEEVAPLRATDLNLDQQSLVFRTEDRRECPDLRHHRSPVGGSLLLQAKVKPLCSGSHLLAVKSEYYDQELGSNTGAGLTVQEEPFGITGSRTSLVESTYSLAINFEAVTSAVA
ncbi:hypothetical protein VNO77_19267 [Canavalia gladiata]|uniref:Uncharacterized protein n=1 Tax=Canavalia gladiata TaxID=3824 RepID=A0AAN9QIC3_CANGL